MSLPEIIGIIAGVASITALALAIHYHLRQRHRVKLLIYEITRPVALATAVSPLEGYGVSVTIQREGLNEERIKGVYTRFLRFANLGQEPIRRDDIAPSNPIRVNIEGVRTLDVGLETVNRSVNNIAVLNQSLTENSSSADISFDFLDYRDGALIKILTEGRQGQASLSGDIIGMPSGIKKLPELTEHGKVSGKIIVLFLLFLVTMYSLCYAGFYWVTGAWTNVWLMALPTAVLIAFIISILIALIASERRRPSFPHSLALPIWAHFLSRYRFYSEERLLRASDLLDKQTDVQPED